VIAEDARKKISGDGIDFGEMARRVTDMNPQQAGELGWLHVDDIAGWMSRAIDELRPGEISSVIETSFGCNLLQLVERRAFTPVTFEQAEARLTDELSQKAMEKEYITWLDTLRKQTYVSRKGLYSESGRIEQITSGGSGNDTADPTGNSGSP
jgi:parvulin-like peptidyl-prolyl isomerase